MIGDRVVLNQFDELIQVADAACRQCGRPFLSGGLMPVRATMKHCMDCGTPLVVVVASL